jgi:PAT family beta-lactamase induction signal transducer AmpG
MNQQDSIENKGNSNSPLEPVRPLTEVRGKLGDKTNSVPLQGLGVNSPLRARGQSPWSWIPTLYFAEGIPYVVAMTVAVIMYKRLGISNTDIALYTSWLYLPWVIKPFWSPFVDIIKTKRWWIVTMQLLIGAGLAGVAFLIPMPFFFQATLAVFWLIAFSSATHDIAADGFYMLALDSSEQSFFVGIRSTFYRLAMISGQGLLIIIAGSLETFTGLEPMQFTVQSSNTKQTENVLTPKSYAVQKSDKMTFIAFPENLILNTNTITTDSLAKIKAFALEQNQKNGFITIERTAKEQKDDHPSWWTQNISTPLGYFIKTKFGEKRTDIPSSDGKVGNSGLVAVR